MDVTQSPPRSPRLQHRNTKMEKIYAFDVDGTLTDPRQLIDPQFNEAFCAFARKNLVYLVTGSDRSKIMEQLPAETLNACYGLFACSAAELWAAERLIYRKEHVFPQALIDAAEHLVDCSPYSERCGNHIEHRAGMLNISTVGRNATPDQRHHYFEWDKRAGERLEFMRVLSCQFPQYELSAGGEISIDIVPYGWTKAVAKTEIELRHFGCYHILWRPYGSRWQRQAPCRCPCRRCAPSSDCGAVLPRHLEVSGSSKPEASRLIWFIHSQFTAKTGPDFVRAFFYGLSVQVSRFLYIVDGLSCRSSAARGMLPSQCSIVASRILRSISSKGRPKCRWMLGPSDIAD